LIQEKTINIHRKTSSVPGPSIVDLDYCIDSEENIHIAWCTNDGTNQFSIWYMIISGDGEILVTPIKIDGFYGYANMSTGFDILPLILIAGAIVVAASGGRRDYGDTKRLHR